MGSVFPMVVVYSLPQAELGLNDHRETASHFYYSLSFLNHTVWVIRYDSYRIVHFKITFQFYSLPQYEAKHVNHSCP